MGRIGKHFQSLDSIRFERTVEDQESSKLEFALNLIPRSSIDLSSALFQCNGLTFEGSKFIVL